MSDKVQAPVDHGSGSPAVAPLGEVSARVQQVHNPAPTVQDLLSLSPLNRVRTVAATAQQDDYFSDLAQNNSLDDKSRQAAAIKVLCSARRDALLTQLEQDSENENALLAIAQNENLEAKERLKAALNLHREEKREAILKKLALDGAIYHEVRWQAVQMLSPAGETREKVLRKLAIRPGMDCYYRFSAALRINSEKLRQMTLDELTRTLSPDYWSSAALRLISEDSRNAALLPLASDAKQGIKLRLEAAIAMTGSSKQEALQSLVSAAKSHQPSQEKEAVLLALANHLSLDIQYRLNAAKALAPGQDKQKALLELAQDGSLEEKYRVEAAYELVGESREEVLAKLAENHRVSARYRYLAATELTSDIKKEILRRLALDGSMSDYRWGILQQLPDKFRDGLLSLAYDRNATGIYRLLAARALASGKEQERALEAIARDGSVDKQQRIAAANALAAEDIKKQILDSIGC